LVLSDLPVDQHEVVLLRRLVQRLRLACLRRSFSYYVLMRLNRGFTKGSVVVGRRPMHWYFLKKVVNGQSSCLDSMVIVRLD
jgi:hypothetical protein